MVATTALFGQDSSENVPRLHTQFIAADEVTWDYPRNLTTCRTWKVARPPPFCTIIMLLIDLSTRQVGGGNADVS
jgi:hypothetical protein